MVHTNSCTRCSLARVEYSVEKHGVFLSDYSQQLKKWQLDCKTREFKSKRHSTLKVIVKQQIKHQSENYGHCFTNFTINGTFPPFHLLSFLLSILLHPLLYWTLLHAFWNRICLLTSYVPLASGVSSSISKSFLYSLPFFRLQKRLQ